MKTQNEVVAFLRRVVLRHSQNMKLGANSLLGLPPITHKVRPEMKCSGAMLAALLLCRTNSGPRNTTFFEIFKSE